MPIQALRLQGGHHDMGFEHGARFKAGVERLCTRRLEALRQRPAAETPLEADTLREISRRVWDDHERYSPLTSRELLGIADGAEQDPLDLLLLTGHADFADLLPIHKPLWQGMTFWTGPIEESQQNALMGQTYEFPADQCDHVAAFHQVPEEGPEVLLLTVQGGVGLAGVNEAGLSIVVNKVRAEDAAPGIVSPFLLRNALQHGSLETAVQALVTAPRMAGGNYLVSDIWGRTINVELSAKKTSLTLLETRPFVHANHYLSEKLGDVQQEMRPAERAVSVARQRRMQTLLTAHQQGMDGEALLHILADHREEVPGGSICRHGEGQALRTCVSVIISPHQRIMWIGAGYPCKTEYLGLQL